MSYYERVTEKKELVVPTQVAMKNDLEKCEENEVGHLHEKLAHERKYREAEYMQLNFEENELPAKKKLEQKKRKVPEEGD